MLRRQARKGRWLAVGAFVCLLGTLAYPQDVDQRFNGSCQQGGSPVTTNGIQSSQKVQISYPSCVVTVFLHGTVTLAPNLWQDSAQTMPLANPFTASSQGTVAFYATDGRYDVQYSGSTITSPFTISDVKLCFSCTGGGGGGGALPGGLPGEIQTQLNSTTFGSVSGSSVDGSGNISLPASLTAAGPITASSFNASGSGAATLASTAGATAPTTCTGQNAITFDTATGLPKYCVPVSLGGSGTFSNIGASFPLAAPAGQTVPQYGFASPATEVGLNAEPSNVTLKAISYKIVSNVATVFLYDKANICSAALTGSCSPTNPIATHFSIAGFANSRLNVTNATASAVTTGTACTTAWTFSGSPSVIPSCNTAAITFAVSAGADQDSSAASDNTQSTSAVQPSTITPYAGRLYGNRFTFDRLLSSTANPARTGGVSLANADFIAQRDNTTKYSVGGQDVPVIGAATCNTGEAGCRTNLGGVGGIGLLGPIWWSGGTKGDLLAFSGTSTAGGVRLPVGTDGQVVTADSAQTLGVKWATPGVSFTGITSGTNTTAAMVTGTGSTHSTSGTGLIAANLHWPSAGGSGLFAPNPALTVSLTGGSLSTGTNIYVKITISNALGESLPSNETNVLLGTGGGATCNAGVVCSVTVTAPTLIGSQTYTVYSSGNGGSGLELKQAAASNCVNITGNCVIQSIGAGASPPSSNATYALNPPNLQTSDCPPSVNPFLFTQDAAGNYRTAAGIDTTTTNSSFSPGGFIEFCRPVIFNMSGVKPDFGSNGGLIVFHQIQNGKMYPVQIQNETPTGTNNYTTPMLGVYSELGLFGSPGFSQTETLSAYRGTVNEARANGAQALGPIIAGVAGSVFRNGTVQAAQGTYNGTSGLAQNSNASSTGTTTFVGVRGLATDATGTNVSGIGYAFRAMDPGGAGSYFASFNVGFYANAFLTNNGGYGLFIDTDSTNTNGRSYLGGPVAFPSFQTNATTIAGKASLALTGSLSTSAIGVISSNPTISNVGTPGSTGYTYAAVGKDGNGNVINVVTNNTTTGNATLNGSNFNTVQLTTGTVPTGISTIDIYRTISAGTPSSVGKIGTITPTNYNGFGSGTIPNNLTLNDTGLAGDSSATPANTNLSGSIKAPGFQTATDCEVNSVSPAACGAAASGAFVVPTTTTTYTVNTTAVYSTRSHIIVTPRAYTGALPSSPTCVAVAVTSAWYVSAASAGTSFTLALPSTTGQTCWDYWIVSNP